MANKKGIRDKEDYSGNYQMPMIYELYQHYFTINFTGHFPRKCFPDHQHPFRKIYIRQTVHANISKVKAVRIKMESLVPRPNKNK